MRCAPPLDSTPVETPDAQPRQRPDCPIVGIGCSAGGLEALEALLGHVPDGTGMAFVIVQHLDPEHVSTLPEILQRITPMPVIEVAEGMVVAPEHVYVIPPNKDLSLLGGVLHLLDPTAQRGLRLPIDFFLRTLAADRQERAIGVILSGMGSDGMAGLAAIKEKGGLTLAQDPASARADSMPASAIKAGVVDIVAPADALAERIATFLRHVPRPPQPDAAPGEQGALERIIVLLRNRSGNDLSLYKPNTLLRRIKRRMALLQIAAIADYVGYLRDNSQELDLLFKELLIGVTSFFRDPPVWDYLRDIALPALFARHPDGQALRAWVPACSTGEEAYSLAMVFRETLDNTRPPGQFSLQIYATDLDPDAVDRARRACYPANITADVTPERLALHFIAEDDGFRLNRELREMVIFAPHNLISDPPFTKLDILSCRNLLIYFGQALQKKVLPCSTTPSTGTASWCSAAPRPSAASTPCSRPSTRRPTSSGAPNTATNPRGWIFPPAPRPAPPAPTATGPTSATASNTSPTSSSSSTTRPPRCWSMARATSCTSAGAPANTSNRPPARSTSTSTRWPAKASATPSPG